MRFFLVWYLSADSQPCSPRACNRTEHRVPERRAPRLSASRQPFWRPPLQRFQTRRSYHSETGPSARNGLSLARNGSRFRGLHSGVKGPGLPLRCLACRLSRPFGHSAPPPKLVCPNSRRFHASGPLHFRPQTHPAALPIPTPLREFSLPRDQSVQSASLPSGPPSEAARSPLAPRSRFYF
jgi:hypothetical protein